MTPVLKFLASIMPTLIEEAVDLYELHKGNASKAKKHIEDRRAAVAAARLRRDDRINQKFPKEG